jgi:hypothetical protein
MGYFSNGSEGDAYQATYCRHCLHNDAAIDASGNTVEDCPVWALHMLRLHNYGQFKKKATEDALAMFIPRAADGSNAMCTMFAWKAANEAPAPQPTLFDRNAPEPIEFAEGLRAIALDDAVSKNSSK